MARRNRAEVVVAEEVGVDHCVQRVVRRAFRCGVNPLSDNSYDHRRSWIRDRLESLVGLFGVEVAAFGSAASQPSRTVPAWWSSERGSRSSCQKPKKEPIRRNKLGRGAGATRVTAGSTAWSWNSAGRSWNRIRRSWDGGSGFRAITRDCTVSR